LGDYRFWSTIAYPPQSSFRRSPTKRLRSRWWLLIPATLRQPRTEIRPGIDRLPRKRPRQAAGRRFSTNAGLNTWQMVMTDKTIDLDHHRGMAAQKATDLRRLPADTGATGPRSHAQMASKWFASNFSSCPCALHPAAYVVKYRQVAACPRAAQKTATYRSLRSLQ
jgi:hypothetical protein